MALALGRAVLTIVPACADNDAFRTGPPPRRVDDPRFEVAATTLLSATDVTLYEGLPHRLFEREKCEAEAKSKAVFRSHGELFYELPLPVTESEAVVMRSTFSRGENYWARDPEVMSLCGGFHADYALRWSVNGEHYEMQFCFGCSDVDLHTPNGLVSLGMGSRRQDGDPFQDVLLGHRAQRPARW